MLRKILFFSVLLSCLCSAPAFAAEKPIPDDKREQYKEKLRQYQHQVISRELDLSRDEANKFFPVYDQMCDELKRVGRETRTLAQRTANNPNASAIECENSARALFEQKKTEAEIELRYFDQFKELLSPQQLLGLRDAEATFRKEIFNHFLKSRKK